LLKEDVRMSRKNLWLGFASLIAVNVALNNLATAIVPQTITAITVQPIVISFLASFAGGFIARERFIFIALGVWAVLWAAIGYMLYLIAAPTGHATVSSIAQHNWVAFLFSGLATVAGAYIGQAQAIRRTRNTAAT